MNNDHSTYIRKLKLSVEKGLLSPFLFDSFLDYQKQRRTMNGAKTK